VVVKLLGEMFLHVNWPAPLCVIPALGNRSMQSTRESMDTGSEPGMTLCHCLSQAVEARHDAVLLIHLFRPLPSFQRKLESMDTGSRPV
jgi:hypothetical protein